MWEGFDEPAHFAYVQHIVENKELPTVNSTISNEVWYTMDKLPLNTYLADRGKFYAPFWSSFNLTQSKIDQNTISNIPTIERTRGSGGIWEAQLPPMAHLVQVPIYLLFYNQDILVRAYALRIFSVLVTALAIFISYRTIALIFKDYFMRLGSLMFMVFNPMFTMDISRVNNEFFTILEFSLFLYLITKFLKEKPSIKLCLSIGLVIGFGLLTKQTFIAAFFLVPIFVWLKCWQTKNNSSKNKWISFLKNTGMILAVTIIISIWWYYDKIKSGNFSGITALHPLTVHDYITGFFQISWYNYYQQFFGNFWGAFGWNFNYPPYPYMEVVEIACIGSTIGLGILILRKLYHKRLQIIYDWRYQCIFVMFLSIIIIILGQSFLNIQFYKIYGFYFTNGWYLFIALTAISILFMLGFKSLIFNFRIKKMETEFLLAEFVTLIVFSSTIFFYLLRKYYLGV